MFTLLSQNSTFLIVSLHIFFWSLFSILFSTNLPFFIMYYQVKFTLFYLFFFVFMVNCYKVFKWFFCLGSLFFSNFCFFLIILDFDKCLHALNLSNAEITISFFKLQFLSLSSPLADSDSIVSINYTNFTGVLNLNSKVIEFLIDKHDFSYPMLFFLNNLIDPCYIIFNAIR